MFTPLVTAALGFLVGMAFLALAQYLIRRLGARRGPTVPSIRPTVESTRPEVEPGGPMFDIIPPAVEDMRPTGEDTGLTVEDIRPAVEDIPPTAEEEEIRPAAEGIRPIVEAVQRAVGSVRPWEIVDEELIAVLAAAASETLRAPVRVLSYRVEPKQ